MAHQHQPDVAVRLAPGPAPIPEHAGPAAARSRRPEARKVLVGRLALAAAVNRPQVAQAVVAVVAARAVSVLAQPRRVDRVAVRRERPRRRGRCSCRCCLFCPPAAPARCR